MAGRQRNGELPYVYETQEDSVLGLLTREQCRELRACAWRHVRRINPAAARKVWSMRRAAKRDANEPELLEIVKAFGAVWICAPPLDGWVIWRGQFIPVEIKNGKNRYTDSQVKFLAQCKERNAPVWTWREPRDVFESLGARQTA